MRNGPRSGLWYAVPTAGGWRIEARFVRNPEDHGHAGLWRRTVKKLAPELGLSQTLVAEVSQLTCGCPRGRVLHRERDRCWIIVHGEPGELPEMARQALLKTFGLQGPPAEMRVRFMLDGVCRTSTPEQQILLGILERALHSAGGRSRKTRRPRVHLESRSP